MQLVTEYSVFWLLPWAACCIIASVWFYNKTPWIKDLAKVWQILFRSLRGAILFILGILIIGLIIEANDYRSEKPIIISLIDNSSSLKNYSDSSSVSNKVKEYQKNLHEVLGEDYEVIELTVGNSTEYSDKLDFKSSLSDLSNGFDKIHNDFYSRNVGGVIFISDGNFNTGSNPVYAAEKLNFVPVFTLGVGDTVKKRDQLIKNVAVNEVTFYKNKFPIEVDLEAIKMGNSSATVSIVSNGKTIASQLLKYKNGKLDFEHVSFLIEADKIGFQAYKVVVSKAGNEFNYKNNERAFYVEVIDSRSKILILSGAPHPDISAMKEVLEQDQNLEVETTLIKDWNKDLNKTDLVIWHEPGIGYDASVNSNIVKSKIPVLYVVGPNTNTSTISQLNIGYSITSSSQTDDVQGVVNESFNQFEISPNLKKSLDYFPPLKSKFGSPKLSGGAEVAIYQRIGSIKKADPLLFFNKKGESKYGVMLGEGLWKWKMNDFVRNKNFETFSELIQKSAQYLMIRQNKSPLQITFPNRFKKDEEIVINAAFYNESFEKITNPKIKFTLTDEKNRKSRNEFMVAGDMYKLVLGKLNPGKYSWTGNTTYNGKVYSKSGTFIVEDISLESLDNSANHALLNLMSSRTRGSYNELKNYKNTLDLIKNREDITSMSIKESSFNDLIDYKILFILLLILAGLEWFMRRWFGGY